MRRIRDDLEKMGFHVEWSAGVDLHTGAGTADVKLWLPKQTEEEKPVPSTNEEPQPPQK